jgi:hypothetical protein
LRLLDNVEFYPMGDRVLFEGMLDNVPPLRLWSTDGTDAGTQVLTSSDVQAFPPCTEGPNGAYFIMTDGGGESGYREFLVHTDGSTAGTRTVVQLPDLSFCGSIGAEANGSRVAYLPVGASLYRSDSTSAGTYPIQGAPLLDTGGGNRAHSMSIVGHRLVFLAPDAANRHVLWRLDLDPIFTNGFDGS